MTTLEIVLLIIVVALLGFIGLVYWWISRAATKFVNGFMKAWWR